MLVRDLGDGWQLVRQPDHADLSGRLAAAWGGEAKRPRPYDSVVLAATRHDDGWGVFDRRPTCGPRARAPDVNFLDVPIPSHLAFYRACIQVVDGRGSLRRPARLDARRRDLQRPLRDAAVAPALRRRGVPRPVDAFVAEQEATHEARASEVGVAEDERWANYKLLQVFDRLSLSFCLKEWESEAAEPDSVSPAPLDYAGTEAELTARAARPVARGDRPLSVRREPGALHRRAQGAAEAVVRGQRGLPGRVLRDAGGDRRDHRRGGLNVESDNRGGG